MAKLDDLHVDISLRGYNQAINGLNGFKSHIGGLKSFAASNAREISTFLAGSSLGGMARFGGAAAAGFGGALASVSTVKMAADMERSRAMLKRFVSEDFKAVTDGLDRMSSKTPVLIADLYKIAEGVAQVGVNGKAIIPMTETIAKLTSIAPDLDPNSAAKEVAKLLNVFQLKPTAAPAVGSTLAGLSADSAADVGELITLTKYLSGSASSMKLSLEQTLAFAAAVKDSGASSEVAGTAFSMLITRMAEEPKALAEAMNMTEKEFKKLRDANPFKLLTDMIKKGAEQPTVDDTMAFADAIGMERARAKGVLLQMAQILDLMDKHAAKAAGYYKEGGKELDRQFGESSGITYAEMSKLANTFTLLGERLGEGVMKALNKGAGAVNALGANALQNALQNAQMPPGFDVTKLKGPGGVMDLARLMWWGGGAGPRKAWNPTEDDLAKIRAKAAEREAASKKKEDDKRMEHLRQVNAENEGHMNRVAEFYKTKLTKAEFARNPDVVAAATALAKSRQDVANEEKRIKAAAEAERKKDPAVQAAGFAKQQAENEAKKGLVAQLVGIGMDRMSLKPTFGDADSMWKRIATGGDQMDIRAILKENGKKAELQTQLLKAVEAAIKEGTAVMKDGALILSE